MRKLSESNVAAKVHGSDVGMQFDFLGLPVVSQQVRPIIRSKLRVGRNDLCDCNSGKKYKKCHGRK